jgi:hypothetical protein
MGPRRGYRVSHTRATTGLGAFYTPRTTVLTPGRTASPTGACRSTTASPCHPAPTSHRARLCFTRHQRRFKPFTRPIFPSPAAARMEQAAASAFPRASHPAGQEPDNARRGGDRPTEHGPETRSTSSTEPPMSRIYSMCATSRRTAESRAHDTARRIARLHEQPRGMDPPRDSRDMALHTTTTRDGLARLLLPWCVDSRDRTRSIRINDEPDLIPHALQLRVRDLDHEDILIALGRRRAEGGDSLEKIQSIRAEATRSARLPAIEDSRACRTLTTAVRMATSLTQRMLCDGSSSPAVNAFRGGRKLLALPAAASPLKTSETTLNDHPLRQTHGR